MFVGLVSWRGKGTVGKGARRAAYTEEGACGSGCGTLADGRGDGDAGGETEVEAE